MLELCKYLFPYTQLTQLFLFFFFPLKEAVVQYEQYEQEMKHLQQMIESAHREIQDKPIATSNIQELQVQISRHEVGAKNMTTWAQWQLIDPKNFS